MQQKQLQMPLGCMAHTCPQLAVVAVAVLATACGVNVCEASLLLPHCLAAHGNFMAVAASSKSGCFRGSPQLSYQAWPMLAKLEWECRSLCRCFLEGEFQHHGVDATVAAAALAARCALPPVATTLAAGMVSPSYQEASSAPNNPWVRATSQIQTTSPKLPTPLQRELDRTLKVQAAAGCLSLALAWALLLVLCFIVSHT
mmetsp:Transcript_128310/g.256266  ORF Transcript_128310/g.256266 Transcript_128310/m.256266 type:complete len:200 (+) Transcript_128310:120-719(+)